MTGAMNVFCFTNRTPRSVSEHTCQG